MVWLADPDPALVEERPGGEGDHRPLRRRRRSGRHGGGPGRWRPSRHDLVPGPVDDPGEKPAGRRLGVRGAWARGPTLQATPGTAGRAVTRGNGEVTHGGRTGTVASPDSAESREPTCGPGPRGRAPGAHPPRPTHQQRKMQTATMADRPSRARRPQEPARGRRHRARRRFNKIWLIVIGVVVVCLAGAGRRPGHDRGKKKAAALRSPWPRPAPPPRPSSARSPAPPPRPARSRRARARHQGGQLPARPAPDRASTRPTSSSRSRSKGRINRLVAVFQCQTPALVGDIRSARAPTCRSRDLLSHPLLVHAGGINPVIALLQAANLTDVDLFTHGSPRPAPARADRRPTTPTRRPAAVWAAQPERHHSAGAGLHLFARTASGGRRRRRRTSPSRRPTTTRGPGTGHRPRRGTWPTAACRPRSPPARPIATNNVVVMTVGVTYGPWAENDIGGLEVQAQMTGIGPRSRCCATASRSPARGTAPRSGRP